MKATDEIRDWLKKESAKNKRNKHCNGVLVNELAEKLLEIIDKLQDSEDQRQRERFHLD